MEQKENLDNILNSKGIILTEPQKENLEKTIERLGLLGNELYSLISQVFDGPIKLLCDMFKEFVPKEETIDIKPKITYSVVKEITPNQYLGLNKPIGIHCRDNC